MRNSPEKHDSGALEQSLVYGIEDYTALFPFETTCILSDPLANADALVALILHRMAQARDGENFGEPQRRIIPCRFAQGDSVGRV